MNFKKCFVRRFFALLLDVILVFIPLALIESFISHYLYHIPIESAHYEASGFLYSIYRATLTIKWDGQTLGKKAMKIRVINSDRTSQLIFSNIAMREFFFIIGYALTFGIGVLISIYMAIKGSDGRTMHDIFARTCVVYESKKDIRT